MSVITPNESLAKTVEYGPGGWHAVVYTDDDGGSGYGENARVGYWYGSREACEALDPSTVPLYPCDGECGYSTDAATATGMYDAW